MRVWRICARRHAARALDGEGARLHGGRWNSPGIPVVYASATLSLAALELLVHVDVDELPIDLVSLALDVGEDVGRDEVPRDALPARWRDHPPPEELLAFGDAWFRSGRTALLVVPSAIVPVEANYLVSPSHQATPRIRITEVESFRFDPRLTQKVRVRSPRRS